MAIRWYERLLGNIYSRINRHIPWYRLPFPLAVANLVAIRTNMRQRNLYNTETTTPAAPPPDHIDRSARTADGSYNDLAEPWMGMMGTRFGRNVPIAETHGEQAPGLYEPNPRKISNDLMARREFTPATTLNVFVPAWLQFMVHDWLSHGANDPAEPRHRIPLPDGDDWPSKDGKITFLRTKPDGNRQPSDEGRPATYRNAETQWWDGSQLYGSGAERIAQVRRNPKTGKPTPHGKIFLDGKGHLPVDETAKSPGLELSGVNGNWWVGLSLMHTLFAREHNAIVDMLRLEHPNEDAEWLFNKARLINTALLVKIHTMEWTPALLTSPEGQFAMRASWWGVLGEEHFKDYGRAQRSEILTGIPASETDHHTAPYAITEEFTSVYRMHPLMPDTFSFRDRNNDSEIKSTGLNAVSGAETRDLYNDVSIADAFYSLGTSHPGALILHNFPNELRQIPKKPGEDIFVDLAATDIFRARERGVPRYCQFRRLMEMKAPKNFEELTENEEWQRELKAIYKDIEQVDLLTGMLAEAPPPGFAFSDTAFRVFILMAGRRIKSDRFYTDDFNEETYTEVGMRWIENNNMRTTLVRHFPDLQPALADVRNAFFPWKRAGA